MNRREQTKPPQLVGNNRAWNGALLSPIHSSFNHNFHHTRAHNIEMLKAAAENIEMDNFFWPENSTFMFQHACVCVRVLCSNLNQI